MKFYEDMIGDEDVTPKSTIFTILTGDHLPFEYTILKDGTCSASSDQEGITQAEGAGYIKIIKEVPGRQGKFSGGPEPIMNGVLKFVEPCKGKSGKDFDVERADLEIGDFGAWQCIRCNHVSLIPIEKGKVVKPFECEAETCGRRSGFRPLFPEDLIKPIWKLPLSPVVSDSIEVYTDIYNFCKKYLVLKDDEYHVVALWIMASWLVDDFTTCPYLCIIAPKSSGKTKVLEVLGELAYRAVSTVSITPASLFRSIELWSITLLVDEAEYQIKRDTEAGQALYGCLNGGYKKGSYAIRTEGDANNRIPACYDLFGFKAIASTELFHPTLESRSIIINMTQGVPKKILIDPGEGAMIRSKLLYWRFETLGKLPIVMPDSLSGRLIEMFIPLFTVAQVLKDLEGTVKPISYDAMMVVLNKTLKEMESMRKEEEHQSNEAMVLEAIIQLEARCKDGYTDEKEHIFIKEITGQLGWEPNQKTLAQIGRVLKVLGIKTTKRNNGRIIQLWNPDVQDRLKELVERYLN